MDAHEREMGLGNSDLNWRRRNYGKPKRPKPLLENQILKVFFDPLPNDKDPSQFKTKISLGFALASLLRCLHGLLPDHNDVRKIVYGSFDGTQPIAEVCESIFRRIF